MSVCQGSEVWPAAMPASGRLYLALPLAASQANLCAGLDEAHIPYQLHDGKLISFDVSPDALQRFIRQVRKRLSSVEIQDARSLLLDSDAEPSLADLLRTNSLARFLSQFEGQWLAALLAERRLTSYFQPIVDCSEPDNVLGYECLLRGLQPAGELIHPGRLYDTARDSRLLHQLDQAARLTAIASAARERIEGRVFINFDPAAIYAPESCLQSTVEAVELSGLRREQIVFEVVNSERIEDERHLCKILEYYRAAGFEAALDDVGAGYRSLSLLSKLRPDFVKLDMELIRDADHDPYKAQLGGKLLELARGLGIPAIAEGVETEAEWLWLRDHGANFAQGYFFGRPAPTPTRPLVSAALVD